MYLSFHNVIMWCEAWKWLMQSNLKTNEILKIDIRIDLTHNLEFCVVERTVLEWKGDLWDVISGNLTTEICWSPGPWCWWMSQCHEGGTVLSTQHGECKKKAEVCGWQWKWREWHNSFSILPERADGRGWWWEWGWQWQLSLWLNDFSLELYSAKQYSPVSELSCSTFEATGGLAFSHIQRSKKKG